MSCIGGSCTHLFAFSNGSSLLFSRLIDLRITIGVLDRVHKIKRSAINISAFIISCLASIGQELVI